MDKTIDKNQLRTTIIGILKKKTKSNFVGIEHDISQVNPEGRFSTLEVREILWELLIQGEKRGQATFSPKIRSN